MSGIARRLIAVAFIFAGAASEQPAAWSAETNDKPTSDNRKIECAERRDQRIAFLEESRDRNQRACYNTLNENVARCVDILARNTETYIERAKDEYGDCIGHSSSPGRHR